MLGDQFICSFSPSHRSPFPGDSWCLFTSGPLMKQGKPPFQVITVIILAFPPSLEWADIIIYSHTLPKHTKLFAIGKLQEVLIQPLQTLLATWDMDRYNFYQVTRALGLKTWEQVSRTPFISVSSCGLIFWRSGSMEMWVSAFDISVSANAELDFPLSSCNMWWGWGGQWSGMWGSVFNPLMVISFCFFSQNTWRGWGCHGPQFRHTYRHQWHARHLVQSKSILIPGYSYWCRVCQYGNRWLMIGT